MNKEYDEEKVKKLMDHPVFVMHDSSAKIIRAQLFFISVATILLVLSGITIGEGSSVLGIKVEGLTLKDVLSVLACLLIYQMAHFLWASWDSILEWRTRQTALGAGGFGGGGLGILDENQALKVRQTTLYAYMTYVLDPGLKNLKVKIDGPIAGGAETERAEIDESLRELRKTLEDPRIEEALWRFDNWFLMFCKSQNWRWLVFEVAIPLVLGVVAIGLSGCELFYA